MAVKQVIKQDTNVIEIKDEITGIEVFEVKTHPDNNFYSPITNFEVFGNTVVLKRVYPEVKVKYRYTTTADLEHRASKAGVNKQLENLLNNNDVYGLTKKMNEYREQLAATEGCIFKEMGKVLSGFQVLAQPYLENAKAISEALPCIITETAINNLNTSAEKTNIDSITGKSSNNGSPNVVVTAGTPKGISAVYQGLSKVINDATPIQIKTAVKGTSAVNVAVDDKNVQELLNVKTGTQLLKYMTYFLNNANKNPDNIAPETSFANVLPNIIAKSTGETTIGSFGSNLSGLHPTLANLISGEEKQYETNLNENTIATGIIPRQLTISSNPETLGGNITTFGKDTHVFTTIDTIEELEKEVGNVRKDVTTMMVHWSKTWANQFLNAYDLDKMHKALQKYKLGDVAYSNKLALNEAGIMWHYVILKDGTLQRGRPIELDVINEMPFNRRTVHIGFIAGYDVNFVDQADQSIQPTPNSITQAQWKTFDLICKTFLNLKPGIGIIGHSDVDNSSTCPGFDVEEYVSKKFGYSSVYTTEDFESADALTVDEMTNRIPQTIASPSTSIENNNIDMEFLSLEDTNKDAVTGQPLGNTDAEIQKALNDIERSQIKVNNYNIEFITSEQDAIFNNNYYDQKRTIANEALYNLRDDRKPAEEQATLYRKILLNNGYIFDTRSNTWLKK